MVKTFITSDLHGELPIIIESFDLLLICGDVVPAHDHYYSFQKEWVETVFVEWVNKLPFKNIGSKVIMTPGNHDLIFERWNENDYMHLNKLTNGRLIVLRNKEYIFEYTSYESEITTFPSAYNLVPFTKKLRIFGTPYCQVFGNWAFMRSEEKLKQKFDEIPENLDILISHSAPDIEKYGMVQQGYYTKNAGCPILADAIKRLKPKFAFCGHIHSGNHEMQTIDGTSIANVSYVDERYEPTNNVLKLYINGHAE